MGRHGSEDVGTNAPQIQTPLFQNPVVRNRLFLFSRAVDAVKIGRLGCGPCDGTANTKVPH